MSATSCSTNTSQLKVEGITGAGRYDASKREKALERYRKKRMQRNFTKSIKYPCRSKQADGQRRVRGRFARRDEVEMNPTNSQVDSSSEGEQSFSAESPAQGREWMGQTQEWWNLKNLDALCNTNGENSGDSSID